MAVIGNNATQATGGPIDRVIVFDWVTGEGRHILIPDVNGDWSVDTYEGDHGITYLASGKVPITHGPYTLTGNPVPPPATGSGSNSPYAPTTTFSF